MNEMTVTQAIDLMKQFRQKASVIGGTGRDYDLTALALQIIEQANTPKKESEPPSPAFEPPKKSKKAKK